MIFYNLKTRKSRILDRTQLSDTDIVDELTTRGVAGQGGPVGDSRNLEYDVFFFIL